MDEVIRRLNEIDRRVREMVVRIDLIKEDGTPHRQAPRLPSVDNTYYQKVEGLKVHCLEGYSRSN